MAGGYYMVIQDCVLKTPVQLMDELDLLDRLNNRKEGKPSIIESFANRTKGFDWVHLGSTDIKIGKLLSVIETTPHLSPPRTGHMGNWEQIVRGRSGIMDFNNSICAQGYGYPLLYCFNQTESDGRNGDWTYLPGSIVSNHNRMELPLYTWNGVEFEKRTRERSFFTPFVQVEWEGKRAPLMHVHIHQMNKFQGMDFRLETAVLYERASLLKEILHELLDYTRRQENPRSLFQDILSHQVALDGEMCRVDILLEGSGYRMGKIYYANLEEMVEAAMLPLQAIHEPDIFFKQISTAPTHMPIISNVLMRILSAIFNTHYPDVTIDRSLMTQPFNPHFHWGGRDMAGYPPKKNGYVSAKSKLRNYKRISNVIIDKFPEVDPIFFVLIPAAVFSLCPTDVHENDSKLLAALITRVKNETDHLIGRREVMMEEIERVTLQWLSEERVHLSRYFLSRFRPRAGILTDGESHESSRPIEPEGFRDLTFQQACMIVGTLMEYAMKD